MSSKLFHTVVVSSALLLGGAAASGCAAVVVSAGPDAAEPLDAAEPIDAEGDVDAAEPVDAVEDVDAAEPVDAVKDVVEDRRTVEIGWPTTKGVYCTSVDGGPQVCCRGVRPDGRPTQCCLPSGHLCTLCEPDESGTCIPIAPGSEVVDD